MIIDNISNNKIKHKIFLKENKYFKIKNKYFKIYPSSKPNNINSSRNYKLEKTEISIILFPL